MPKTHAEETESLGAAQMRELTKKSLRNAPEYLMPRAVYHDSHNFDN